VSITITYQIPGVPLLDQLHEKTIDGMPDENTRMNCVFTSNACYASAVTGKSYNGDQLKDMDNHYGQGYTGGASEANLVDTMAKLGIEVTRAAASTQQGLIDIIHREVLLGHGVIVTMPSQWNSALTDPQYAPWNPRTYDGPTHVGLMCGVGEDSTTHERALRCMNPWDAIARGWHDGTDSYWAARLVKGEVWILVYTGVKTMTVPTGWKDDGMTLVAPNGVPVVHGFRTWVLAPAWEASNWPLKPEQKIAAPDSVEPGNASIGPGSRQDFRLGPLGYTATRNVYVIYVGQDIIALKQQLATEKAHSAQLQQQNAALQKQVSDLTAQLAKLSKPDPVAAACLAAFQQIKAALGEL
jgi:hypothetical protein